MPANTARFCGSDVSRDALRHFATTASGLKSLLQQQTPHRLVRSWAAPPAAMSLRTLPKSSWTDGHRAGQQALPTLLNLLAALATGWPVRLPTLLNLFAALATGGPLRLPTLLNLFAALATGGPLRLPTLLNLLAALAAGWPVRLPTLLNLLAALAAGWPVRLPTLLNLLAAVGYNCCMRPCASRNGLHLAYPIAPSLRNPVR